MRPRDAELHAAVLAHPDDDAPRLVYADWLGERGDPWGELIAVQIARTHADTPALEARERELLALMPHPTLMPHQLTHRRGFIEVLAADCRELAGALADTCVRELAVFDGSLAHEAGAIVAASLDRMRLRSLALTMTSDDDLAALLAALDGGLEAFTYGLPYVGIATSQIAAITRSALRVSALALRGITADAVAVLAAWHPLRSLSLEQSRIGMSVFEKFVRAPAFARLAHLDLSDTAVGEEDVFAIAASDMPLVSLGLSGNIVGPAAARCIAETPRFAALDSLRLADCEIGHAGVEALIASPYLRRDLRLGLDGFVAGLMGHLELPGVASSWMGSVPEPLASRFDVVIEGAPHESRRT